MTRKPRPTAREQADTPTPSAGSSPWDFFEAVFCISVKDRQDRRQKADLAFRLLGLQDRVEYLLVERHPSDSSRGIFESHRKCLNQGLARGAQTILIFEDDLQVDRFDAERLDAAIRFLSGKDSWDLFALGCLIRGRRKTASPMVQQIVYHALTHAYAVSRPFAETLVSLSWQGVPIDGVLRKQSKTSYGLMPFCAFQSDSPTDNQDTLGLDRVRRIFGGLATVQRMNEFYYCNRTAVIAAHLLAIVLIGAWLW